MPVFERRYLKKQNIGLSKKNLERHVCEGTNQLINNPLKKAA